MAYRRPLAAAVAALALAGVAQADPADHNRTLSSSHEPVVSRTDYSFDVLLAGDGLAPGEARRLDLWLDRLDLGYGDSVAVAGRARVPEGVGEVLSRYGMLVSAEPAPTTTGMPAPGAARVVVSRAVARVEDCPNWSRGNYGEYEGATRSNFGCATAQNLAAMIANPQDLVRGVEARGPADARLSVKAVAAWRDAPATGKNGIQTVSSKGGN